LEKLKIEAGKYYRTRDGRKARIDCIIEPVMGKLKYPCVGELEGWLSKTPPSWQLDGSFDSVEREQDLVAEWKEPKRIKGWMNIYDQLHEDLQATVVAEGSAFPGTTIFSNKLKADEAAVKAAAWSGNRIACVEIDVLEGQGVDGSAR